MSDIRWWYRRGSLLRVTLYVLCPLLFHTRLFSRIVTAGHTYCGIGALTFLGRLESDRRSVPLLTPGTEGFESLVRWLVARQTTELGDDDDDESGSEAEETQDLSDRVEQLSLENIHRLPNCPVPTADSLRWAGFNGRSNKYADTCYSFWNTATLAVSPRPCGLSVACAD